MSSTGRAPPSVCSHQILFFDALIIGVFGLLHALLTDALVAAGFIFTGARVCASDRVAAFVTACLMSLSL
jgi:hypothetical protein